MIYPGDMVRLRLDVEGMRYSVLQAISAHEEDLKSMVNGAVDQFIKSGEMEREIAKLVGPAIREKIRSAIDMAVGEAVYHHKVSDLIGTIVAKALKERL